MNTNKLVAIAGSFLIASGGVAAIRAWANASAAATMRTPAAEVDGIQTLPVITVRPTREQLDSARRPGAKAEQANSAASGGGFALDMPYYSFGQNCCANAMR